MSYLYTCHHTGNMLYFWRQADARPPEAQMVKELNPREAGMTAEMVTAGSEVLAEEAANLVEGWTSPDDLARQVYRAMQRAQP